MSIAELLAHPITLTTAASTCGYVLGEIMGRATERKRNRAAMPEPVDLRNLADHERLAAILATVDAPIIGDANIRDGKVVPTVRPTAIPELGRELRWLADRRRGNDFLLTDRHIKALIEAASVIERVAEDRRRSRSLYKGLTDEELTAIARGAMERVFPLLRDEIRSGKQDDHNCAKTARAAVEQLFSIKGAGA